MIQTELISPVPTHLLWWRWRLLLRPLLRSWLCIRRSLLLIRGRPVLRLLRRLLLRLRLTRPLCRLLRGLLLSGLLLGLLLLTSFLSGLLCGLLLGLRQMCPLCRLLRS